jgi:hypothetical protein
MTTALLLYEWRLKPSGERALIVYRNGYAMCCAFGKVADDLARLILAGAGADEVEERIETMRKEENVK